MNRQTSRRVTRSILLSLLFLPILPTPTRAEPLPGGSSPATDAVDPGPGGSARCPLYFLDIRETRGEDAVRVVGSLANAGPDRARGVRVEVHAIGDDEQDLGTFTARLVPDLLPVGTSGSFEVRMPLDEWTRATAAVRFDHSRLEAHLVRCEETDRGPVDSEGRTRADYLRLALDARQEVELLEHALRHERTEVHSAIIRKEREAYRDIPQIEERLRELRRYLDQELPSTASAAGAPEGWLNLAP